MKIEYLKGILSLEDLKKEFKKLAFKFHPDLGGSVAAMQQLNNEYDFLSERLSNTAKAHNEAEKNKAYKDRKYWGYETSETAIKYRTIIEALIKYKDLTIEICGSWLWISGNTKDHKDLLKGLGLRWARNKGMWYLGESTGHRHKPLDMNDIRSKYGSTEFTDNNNGPKLVY